MANVIDSLFIQLGLDVSQFNKSKKDAIDGLKDVDKQEQQLSQRSKKRNNEQSEEERKISDASEKRRKTRLQQNKEEAESYSRIAESVIKFGSAIVSIGAAKEFVINQVKTNAQLGRTSQLLGTTTKELDAWGAAAKSTGGDARGFQGAIENIQSGLAKFRIGQGGQDIVTALAQLGVQSKNGKVNLLELGDALKKIRDQEGELTAKSFAERLGFDEGAYFLLTKNRGELENLVNEMASLSGKTDENAEKARKLQESWSKVSQEFKGLSSDIFTDLAPGLEYSIKLLDSFLARQRKSDSFFKWGLVGIGKSLYGAVGDVDSASSKGKQSASGKIVTHSGSADAQSIVDFFKSKGWTEDQAKGITANIIRESRGNASAVGDNGSAYGLGQWHPDRQAQFKQLFGKDIQGSSVQEQLTFFDWELKNSHRNAGDLLRGTNNAGDAARAVSLYHERPAGSFLEANYRANLANNLPLTTDQSNNSTSSNVQTHIDTINVTTQVQDALGFSRELKEALSKNQVMNAGVGGAV